MTNNDEIELPELYHPGLTGCSDGGCIIKPPQGMHTNGGCGCERTIRRGTGAAGLNAVRTIHYLRDQLRQSRHVPTANTSEGCVKESAEREHERAQAAEPVVVNEAASGERQSDLSCISDTQRAAEPVGWFTEDHLTDKSATTYSREVAERWKAKGWPVTAFFTRAAPAEVSEEMVEKLALWMAESDGHDPHQLIWQGQPPEPYGEAWHTYLPQARDALEAALGGGE